MSRQSSTRSTRSFEVGHGTTGASCRRSSRPARRLDVQPCLPLGKTDTPTQIVDVAAHDTGGNSSLPRRTAGFSATRQQDATSCRSRRHRSAGTSWSKGQTHRTTRPGRLPGTTPTTQGHRSFRPLAATRAPPTRRLPELPAHPLQRRRTPRTHTTPPQHRDAQPSRAANLQPPRNTGASWKRRSRLEPCAGKLARTVLRGAWGRKAPRLPDSALSNPTSLADRASVRTKWRAGGREVAAKAWPPRGRIRGSSPCREDRARLRYRAIDGLGHERGACRLHPRHSQFDGNGLSGPSCDDGAPRAPLVGKGKDVDVAVGRVHGGGLLED